MDQNKVNKNNDIAMTISPDDIVIENGNIVIPDSDYDLNDDTSQNDDDIANKYRHQQRIENIDGKQGDDDYDGYDDKIPTLHSCRNCKHFIPDSVNPGGGYGKCIVKNKPTLPMKPACRHFLNRGDSVT